MHGDLLPIRPEVASLNGEFIFARVERTKAKLPAFIRRRIKRGIGSAQIE
jgi:hypothetical protein